MWSDKGLILRSFYTISKRVQICYKELDL